MNGGRNDLTNTLQAGFMAADQFLLHPGRLGRDDGKPNQAVRVAPDYIDDVVVAFPAHTQVAVGKAKHHRLVNPGLLHVFKQNFR